MMLLLWLLSYLIFTSHFGDAKNIDPNVGDSNRFVALDGTQKKVNYPECELPDGERGLCKPKYLCTEVKLDQEESYVAYIDHLCGYENNKIGVCCPTKIDDLGPDFLAGELPAVAPKDEDIVSENLSVGNQARGCGLSTRAHAASPGIRATEAKEWPWMASVTPKNFEQYCGGMLITDTHVLTATHCIYNLYVYKTKHKIFKWKAEDLSVRLGEYDLRRMNDTRSFNFQVSKIREHIDFDIQNYINDIAMLKLNRSAIFSSYIWPVCLPPEGLVLVNQTAYITGWGSQQFQGVHSTVLMEVSVPIWDLEQCQDSFTDSVFDTNICAGDYNGGKDSCQGDSGGPLMYQMSSGRWIAVGIVSWGIKCGNPNHPGVYTSVDKYLPWIYESTRTL